MFSAANKPIMLSDIMLSVVILSVVMLSFVMVSVMAPSNSYAFLPKVPPAARTKAMERRDFENIFFRKKLFFRFKVSAEPSFLVANGNKTDKEDGSTFFFLFKANNGQAGDSTKHFEAAIDPS